MKTRLAAKNRRRGLALSLVAGGAAAAVGITMVSTAGAQPPDVPEFTQQADPYQPEDNQATCDPTEKPGVRDFRDLVLEQYTDTTDGGIALECDGDDVTEHKEGRAWDWMVDAKTQGDQAEELLDWLLAERDGDPHSLMRRFGIMYVIWNGEIISSYKIDEGWRDYTGSDPHSDHVHFSFSWDGADQKTSWWTSQGPESFCDKTNLDFESYPDLSKGDSGEEVAAAECLLDNAGYPVEQEEETSDGKYDGKTVGAAKKFQQQSGIETTGDIDASTWTALLARGSTLQVKEGDENRHVGRLQRVMTAATGGTVPVTGKFDAELSKVIKQYQEKAELDADGIVGPDTWRAMRAGMTL